MDIIFNKNITGPFRFELPQDHKALSVYLDNRPVNPILNQNIMFINLEENYNFKEFALRDNYNHGN